MGPICLNRPDLFMIRMGICLLLGFICYMISFPRHFFLALIFLCWASGLGHSPFSDTDYLNGYLGNLKFYETSFFGAPSAPSNAIAGIRKIEAFGWQILRLINNALGYGWALQAFCGLMQLTATWLLVTIFRVPTKAKMLGLIILLFSVPSVLASDWYLRQGLGWAMFVIAIAAASVNTSLFLRLFSFAFFCTLGILFHLSTLVLIGCFILAWSINMALRRFRTSHRLSAVAAALITSVLVFLIIFPIRTHLVPTSDILSVLYPNTPYVALYAKGAWIGKPPGAAIGIYLILASLAWWVTSNYSDNIVAKSLPLTMLLLVGISAVGSLTSELATRMLFPFFVLWCGAIFSGFRRMPTRMVLFFLALTSIAILSHAILMIVIENGGLPRPNRFHFSESIPSEGRRSFAT